MKNVADKCVYYCRKKPINQRECELWYGLAPVKVKIISGPKKNTDTLMCFCSKHKHILQSKERVLVLIDGEVVRVEQHLGIMPDPEKG